MPDRHDEDLIHKETCDDPCTTTLLEQYKMYVQTADSVSARRVATSRYLLTLSAALIAVYGFQLSLPIPWYLALSVPAAGVAVSLLWYKIIKSHRDLNGVKFKIIHDLEQHLPASLFTREWRMLGEGDSKSYTKVTDIERWIPFLFMGLHVLLFVALLWSMPIPW